MRSKIKKTISLLMLLVLSGCAITAAALWYRSERHIEFSDNAYVQGDITQVSGEVGGRVVELLISDHQRVEAGDLLARIDDTRYRAELARAQAKVANVRAAEKNLAAKILLQQELIREAEAALDGARIAYERAQSDRQRSQALSRKGWVSEQQDEQLDALEKSARSKVSQAESALASRRKQLDVFEAEQVTLVAALNEAQAQVVLAQKALEDTYIKAPVAGIVGNRDVRLGNVITPGVPLLAIVPLDRLWIQANLKETQLDRVAPGQRVDIRLDSFPGQAISGRVHSISPASGAEFSLIPPSNATGNFIKVVQRVETRIHFEIPAGLKNKVRPGMSAEIRVDTASSGVES